MVWFRASFIIRWWRAAGWKQRPNTQEDTPNFTLDCDFSRRRDYSEALYLITGDAGFIGSYIADEFCAAGKFCGFACR
jgi:hypothetical protein